MDFQRELTRKERATIRKLVTEQCANYDPQYGCLPLECSCYMLGKWQTGAYCKYFEKAVLLLDPVLQKALTGRAAATPQKFAPCVERNISQLRIRRIVWKSAARRDSVK